MKNSALTILVCGAMLLSSCGTSTGSGAFSGAMVGGWFGSAIGGILGGPHGHDVGTVLGMATGAAVGAASGAAEEQRQQDRIAAYHQRVAARDYSGRYSNGTQTVTDDSGYDSTNSGDDRIDFQSGTTDATPIAATTASTLEMRNIIFTDANGDGTLQRDELGKISFEIKNTSSVVMYDIVPSVVETSGNSHILISPSAHIENIAPGQTLRYTAMVKADNSLKDGAVAFNVSLMYNGKTQNTGLSVSFPTSKIKN